MINTEWNEQTLFLCFCGSLKWIKYKRSCILNQVPQKYWYKKYTWSTNCYWNCRQPKNWSKKRTCLWMCHCFEWLWVLFLCSFLLTFTHLQALLSPPLWFHSKSLRCFGGFGRLKSPLRLHHQFPLLHCLARFITAIRHSFFWLNFS